MPRPFQSGLKENGHVEVPGIYFDFGKSDAKRVSRQRAWPRTALGRTHL